MALTKKHWYGIIGAGVAVALVLAGFNIRAARKAEKERAMIYELSQLRTAVQIFAKTQGSRPGNIVTVMSFRGPDQKPITLKIEKDSKGNPVDPFGTPYGYDKGRGWIFSATRGYETW